MSLVTPTAKIAATILRRRTERNLRTYLEKISFDFE
jgi:hypothetical protein